MRCMFRLALYGVQWAFSVVLRKETSLSQHGKDRSHLNNIALLLAATAT